MKRAIAILVATVLLFGAFAGTAFAEQRHLKLISINGVSVGGGTTTVGTSTGGAGRRIEISLSRQRLSAFVNGRLVRTFLVSTGRPGFRTPSGRFRILAKGLNWWSHKWRVWMPFAMNFYSNYNLHSLPYAVPGHLIGASELGTPRSHGCVRIAPDNARWLYYWAPIGTPLWIH